MVGRIRALCDAVSVMPRVVHAGFPAASAPSAVIRRTIGEYALRRQRVSAVELVERVSRSDRPTVNAAFAAAERLPFETNPLSVLMYATVMLLKPDVVVETGIGWGYTSAAILAAMQQTKTGVLYSIDLPPEVTSGRKLGDGITYTFTPDKPLGWIVEPVLRGRWKGVLGDAATELPKVLNEAHTVDIFLHDSLHTEEHMTLEYGAAWRHLNRGGVLMSDDLNIGFVRFAKQVGRPFMCCQNSVVGLAGAMIK